MGSLGLLCLVEESLLLLPLDGELAVVVPALLQLPEQFGVFLFGVSQEQPGMFHILLQVAYLHLVLVPVGVVVARVLQLL